MQTHDFTFIVIMLFLIAIQISLNYFINKSQNVKKQLLSEKLSQISKIYLASLIVIRDYYADKEDYANAQMCKNLIEDILKNDETLNI